jgi:hypothetical protein
VPYVPEVIAGKATADYYQENRDADTAIIDEMRGMWDLLNSISVMQSKNLEALQKSFSRTPNWLYLLTTFLLGYLAAAKLGL